MTCRLGRADTDGWNHDQADVRNAADKVQVGGWTQLTASYEDTPGLIPLYVNGTLAATGHHAKANTWNATGPWFSAATSTRTTRMLCSPPPSVPPPDHPSAFRPSPSAVWAAAVAIRSLRMPDPMRRVITPAYHLFMGPLKPNVIDLIVALLCFAAAFALMAKVLLPRIGKVLVAREAAIDGVLASCEDTQLEAQRVLAVYQAELAAARHEASRIRQTALEEGAALLAEVRAEGVRAREELVAASAVQLQADRVVAEAELREDVLGLATELAGRILGEPLTDARRNRAVADAFFAEVE
ncbi:hypothetical protein ACQKM2_15685 [Streptomyces sp. NPDC004126]|uniref:F0F1 ATP synthase subunit B family protein n=1 Tax=Streptomyces sp. NPDC004126 TaxID=3390695 RepID=UPI003CFD05C9